MSEYTVIEGKVRLRKAQAEDGALEITGQSGVIVAGTDGANIRHMRTATDGTVRVDPTGTTTQPVSAASLPLPAGAATEVTLAAIDAVLDTIYTRQNDRTQKTQITNGTLDATITADAGVNRQEIIGKVSVVGAGAPPSTTAQVINADTPLIVTTNDTVFVIPNATTYALQNIIAGNEDPTKGCVVEVIFNDGSEHLIERIYRSGSTQGSSYDDVDIARDGTALLGNGTNEIIVRRTRYAGSAIAIDAVVTGYTK